VSKSIICYLNLIALPSSFCMAWEGPYAHWIGGAQNKVQFCPNSVASRYRRHGLALAAGAIEGSQLKQGTLVVLLLDAYTTNSSAKEKGLRLVSAESSTATIMADGSSGIRPALRRVLRSNPGARLIAKHGSAPVKPRSEFSRIPPLEAPAHIEVDAYIGRLSQRPSANRFLCPLRPTCLRQ
jgi:hypothetical protein